LRIARRKQENGKLTVAGISLLSALIAGALSFLSPCVLPLVPPYLCYMAGVTVEDFRAGGSAASTKSRNAVILSSFFFTLGFASVFIALGAGASAIGLLLRQYIDILAKVGGLIIIVMGLNFLGLFRISLFSREARLESKAKPATLSGAYLMGLAFAFGWTPCIGPVLGAILGIAAASDTAGTGAFLLAIYSLGLAVPFWIAALFSSAFMRFLVRFRRHLGLVEKAMGVLLIITGVAFLTGFVADVSFWFQETFPILSQIG
jgi:cytochrome c-type biogenesis protein